MNFKSIEELLEYTKNIIGKKFGEFDLDGKLKNDLKDKGKLGKVIETGFYHYPNNNKAEADFSNLGVELKVAGYIKNKNGTISAKERLVLGRINYNEIVKEEFNYSKLLFKNKKILIIWYEYEKGKKYKDFIITKYQLYDLSGDELVIRNDFEIIKEKVIKGYAHLLSEGDTAYLGACTKGTSSKDRTKQPFSDILAMPRAFSLKNSYMTGILRNIGQTFEFSVDELEYKSVEEYVFAQIKKFIGKTQLDIYYSLTGKTYNKGIPKNLNKMISDRVIGKDEELQDKNDLFKKTNYVIKNIPVNKDYYPLEMMSFRNLVLSEFEEPWENSRWKSYFEEVTFIVLCYEGNSRIKNGFRLLKDIKKISFTDEEVQLLGRTYNMVRNAIIKKDIKKLPYPKSFDGQIMEISPKGVKGDDYNKFFNKDVTRVCFRISKDFIFKKLCEFDNQ